MIEITTIDIIARILLAVGLGSVLGLERTLASKGAGMRTYAMVAIGSAAFVIASVLILSIFPNPEVANPTAMASAVITGIGFIGAGLVIFQDHKITGITTAAGLWVSSAVGVAAGFGFLNLAVIVTIVALVIFPLRKLEGMLMKYSYRNDIDDNNHTTK
ncbi:MAG: MgtC/SapB family protein [Candidatus Paceibacterota bacterium]